MKWILLLSLLFFSCGGSKALKDSYSPLKETIYEEMTPEPPVDLDPPEKIASIPTFERENRKSKLSLNLKTMNIEGKIPPTAAGESMSNNEALFLFKSQLHSGAVAYSIPDTMVMGTEYLVELRIDDKVSEQLSTGLGEDITIKIVEVSQTMRAEITGKGFDIDSSFSSLTQLRKFDQPTSWKWGVTPFEYGDKTLKIKIVCILKREGFSDETYDLITHLDTINVKINSKFIVNRVLKENWKSILGFIFSSGIITWIIAKTLKKKKGPVA